MTRYSKGDSGGYAGLDADGDLHRECCAFLWPIGSVYQSVVSTNPATLFGFGTWVAFGAGRTLVGIDAGQAEFDTVRETGGAKTHTLVEGEIPAHTHVTRIQAVGLIGSVGVSGALSASNANASNGATAATGGGGAHNNLPPYIVVYMWERTG